jgi:ferredoxin/flavodoxin---NADP+ reductase
VSGFVEGRVVTRREWAPGLVTLTVDAAVKPHVSGQFRNLALPYEQVNGPARAELPEGALVKRPYSLASPPGAPLEFLLTRVEAGQLTPCLVALREGDAVLVEDKPQGFFTLAYVPPARDLWCVATGTGLGPFLALLRDPATWERFERLVVVHGVRTAAELAHRDFLEAQRSERLVYVPVTSREDAAGALRGRVTTLYESGALEAAVGFAAGPERAHVMLCGNPEMITELSALLAARGLEKHRVRKPGHVSFEKYW